MNNTQLKAKYNHYKDLMATYNAIQFSLSKWKANEPDRLRRIKADINTEMQIIEGFLENYFGTTINWDTKIAKLKDDSQ